MSLKCNCESILGSIDHWFDISITKRNIIKKLCNKQIPKAIEFDENDLNICPVCKEYVGTDDKYCRYCGQRIFIEV